MQGVDWSEGPGWAVATEAGLPSEGGSLWVKTGDVQEREGREEQAQPMESPHWWRSQ